MSIDASSVTPGSTYPAPPVPDDEDVRLAALRRYSILDTKPDPAFDRITDLASRIFGVPIVLVTLVDEERQWFKSACGLDITETPRGHAFCAYTIYDRSPLVVEDATRDLRFLANPLVTGQPHIRFYAGAPLLTDDGQALGSLCLIDRRPRSISPTELTILSDLADLVIDEMELRLALQMARSADEERIELIATVAHEVRNPLTGALGLADILSDDSRLESEQRDHARAIRDAVRDADHIIEDLLVLSRLDRGSFDVDVRPVRLAHEVAAVVESLERGSDELPISVSDEIWVAADPLRFRQVLRNLLSNARRYGGPGVKLQAIESAGLVELDVVDDGPGVDPGMRTQLFQSFARGGPGRRHAQSSGLGLAVSRRLARLMGGDLTYHRIDGETRFRLTLPLDRPGH